MNVTEDPLRVIADLRPAAMTGSRKKPTPGTAPSTWLARLASPKPRHAAVVSTCSLAAGAAGSSLALG